MLADAQTCTAAKKACVYANARTQCPPPTLASAHTRADCFIMGKWSFLKRPGQCLSAVFFFGTTNESGAQPWRPV